MVMYGDTQPNTHPNEWRYSPITGILALVTGMRSAIISIKTLNESSTVMAKPFLSPTYLVIANAFLE